MIPVSILHKDLVLLQMRRQLLPVQIACTSIYGQVHGVSVCKAVPGRKPAFQLLNAVQDFFQLFPEQGRRQFPVAPVQRCQHEIGRTGRAEHRHRIPDTFRLGVNVAAHMEIRCPRQTRQHLMRRVTAIIRTQLNGVTLPRQKRQMSAVGIVHQKLGVIPVTQLRQSGNVRHPSQIIRRCHIDARRSGLCLQSRLKICQIVCSRQNAVALPGIDPLHGNIQQHTGVQKRPVYISRRQHPAPLLFHQQQHGLDAEGRAAAGVERIRRPIERRRIFFTLRQNARCLKQAVCAGDLRDVQRRRLLQRRCAESALMPRHMQPNRILLCVIYQKVIDWCIHDRVILQFSKKTSSQKSIRPQPAAHRFTGTAVRPGNGRDTDTQLPCDLRHGFLLFIV